MSEVIIKVNTGFVGGIHEEPTGLSVEEWSALSKGDRNAWMNDVLHENCHAYAVDEDGNELD